MSILKPNKPRLRAAIGFLNSSRYCDHFVITSTNMSETVLRDMIQIGSHLGTIQPMHTPNISIATLLADTATRHRKHPHTTHKCCHDPQEIQNNHSEIAPTRNAKEMDDTSGLCQRTNGI